MQRKLRHQTEADIDVEDMLEKFHSLQKKKNGSLKIHDALYLLKKLFNVQLVNFDVLQLCNFSPHQNISFDDFLTLKYQAEIQNGVHKDIINYKMLQFIKLLQNYRTKCQRSSMYKEAQKTHQKILQIKDKQMQYYQRRLFYQNKSEVQSIGSLKHSRIEQFNNAWDNYMKEYDKSIIEGIQKLKAKHLLQMQKEQQRIKKYYSNQQNTIIKIIDLKNKQKQLAKQRQYEKAQKIKSLINDIYLKQNKIKNIEMKQQIQKRKKILQKHQQATLLSHLSKIQKQRNQKIKQRQLDSKLMKIKLKSIQKDLTDKQNFKIRQTLHSITEAMQYQSVQRSRHQIRPNNNFKSRILENNSSNQYGNSIKIRVNSLHKTRLKNSIQLNQFDY